MAHSLTSLYVVLFFALIFIAIATILCFVAPSYLLPVPTSTSVTANHQSAQSMLYGAGILGVIVFFLFLFDFYNAYERNITDLSPMDAITAARFGGLIIFLDIILILLVTIMVVLIFYAISLIDVTVANTGTSGRTMALVAVAMVIIVLIFLIVSFFLKYYSYNAYLDSLLLPVPLPSPVQSPVVTTIGVPTTGVITGVPVVQPKPTMIGDNTFTLIRNADIERRQFTGRVTVDGLLKSTDPEYLTFNGTPVLNTARKPDTPVKSSITWVDGVDTPVLNVPVQPVIQPVVQPVVVQPVRRANQVRVNTI